MTRMDTKDMEVMPENNTEIDATVAEMESVVRADGAQDTAVEDEVGRQSLARYYLLENPCSTESDSSTDSLSRVSTNNSGVWGDYGVKSCTLVDGTTLVLRDECNCDEVDGTPDTVKVSLCDDLTNFACQGDSVLTWQKNTQTFALSFESEAF
uniref:Uncharacterized protein n=2 Tax=Lygus hesperus TaxID=30085 RepID=A0A146L3S8_LYGHE